MINTNQCRFSSLISSFSNVCKSGWFWLIAEISSHHYAQHWTITALYAAPSGTWWGQVSRWWWERREGLAVVMVMLGCGVSKLSTVGDMAHPTERWVDHCHCPSLSLSFCLVQGTDVHWSGSLGLTPHGCFRRYRIFRGVCVMAIHRKGRYVCSFSTTSSQYRGIIKSAEHSFSLTRSAVRWPHYGCLAAFNKWINDYCT